MASPLAEKDGENMTASPLSPSAGCAAVNRVDGSLAAGAEGSRGLSALLPCSSWLAGGAAAGAGSVRATGWSTLAPAGVAGGGSTGGALLGLLSTSAIGCASGLVSVFGASTCGGECGRVAGATATVDVVTAGRSARASVLGCGRGAYDQRAAPQSSAALTASAVSVSRDG